MKGLLVRVAADQSKLGGGWNGPADSSSGRFVYAPIPESWPLHQGMSKPYAGLNGALASLGRTLPPHLAKLDMHLDPDFDHLTYGDWRERAKQIRAKVGAGDLLVFYAGMRDVQPPAQLLYALIGLYVVDAILPAVEVPAARWDENAHTRRVLAADATDVIVRAKREVSGRLERCIPIGSYRERAYRVRSDLLSQWGGLTVKNGYLQRSARLPEFTDARRFYTWFLSQSPKFKMANN